MQPQDVQITLLATADVHGRFLPYSYAADAPDRSGSLAQIATVVARVREQAQHVLLLDAGDAIQDNFCERFATCARNPMVEAMNAMGTALWVMGNHEFNFDEATRKRCTDAFSGTALCGNVYREDGTRDLPATFVWTCAGVRIGFIGVTTPLIAVFEDSSGTLDGFVVKPAVQEVREAIAQLRPQCDAIVGVLHMGVENENGVPGTGVRDVIAACPGMDVVVAAHMHQRIEQCWIGDTLVTEPYKNGMAVSRIDLQFERTPQGMALTQRRARLLEVRDVPPDPALVARLQPFHAHLRQVVNEPIGRLCGGDLTPPDRIPGIASIHTQSTPLFALFHEVAAYYGNAQVSAFCTDCERPHFVQGPIRLRDIAYHYTYTDGDVTTYQMTGADLRAYMEWSAGYFAQMGEGDVLVAYDAQRRAKKYSTNDLFGGVRYEIDVRKPQGQRIGRLRFLDGRPIEADTPVRIAMNSYRMNSLRKPGEIFCDKWFPWTFYSLGAYGETDGTLRNLIVRYIREVKGGVITPNLDRNWRLVGMDLDGREAQEAVRLLRSGKLHLHNSADGTATNIAPITRREVQQALKREREG